MKLLRGALYCAGFVTWGLAVGGVGRLAVFVLTEIRENDRKNTRLVVDVETRQLHSAILLSPPLKAGANAKPS
jgi:hypothetical protein